MQIFWITYSGLLLLLGCAQSVHKISAGSGGIGSQWGPIIGTAILALGLYCWRAQRPLLKRFWWQVFWVLLLLSYLFLIVLFLKLFVSASFSVAFYLLLAALLLLLPGIYGLGRYAFRSPEIWRAVNNDREK